jgi:hypothetical protein
VRHGHRHRHGSYHGHAGDAARHIVCRHRVEIEVWPARAEINFQDEWTANPIDTQIRFEAQIYNSDQGYLWEVRDINGNPGQGSIDVSGLYRAPAKGSLTNGTTEIVVATAREDRLRKAYAWVTLVGVGPQPAPLPEVAIWPKRLELYFFQGADNSYIDDCNKEREFSAAVYDSSSTVQWLLNGTLQGTVGPWFSYQAPNTGGTQTVTLQARLQSQPSVYDEAKILLRNYNWPGL